jgi:alpha-beta hydrolase superfamily lysophospholipase
MSLTLWIGIFILFSLIAYFGVGAYAALKFTKVGEHPQYHDDPANFGLDFKNVMFNARGDQLKIAAWYIPQFRATKAIILVHGRFASKQNAISGTLPRLAAELNEAGLAVLMIDLRAHGESEGKRYTWGVDERRDVLGAVDFLLDQGFIPGNIAVLGISSGGAAAIGATAEEPAIGALVVESTFADLNALVKTKWEEGSGLPFFFLPAVYWMCRILFGSNLRDLKPAEEIKRVTPRPILILHCTADEDVDISHAYGLARAVPDATLAIFDGCSHAEIYRDRSKEYLEALLPFLKQPWIT